ncbi:hypothetical protein [Polyangium mundeleinium]|uniref:CHASE2 domain-containing protein n=1 Tax=Polyangium mundeleinium TaxID=2995306 RepID=A0ABT5F2A5_9BACT|nr:hypothetical protein [Polyangium mundeleinium]MDC0748200.1 hypothetical protein [Polyangium mundeleinium]
MRSFARRLLETRKIPKPFRAPRPMAFEKDRSRLSSRARLEATAILVAGITAAIAPLGSADDEARELTLRAIAGKSPSSHVLVVHASPATLAERDCLGALSELVVDGHARGVLIVPPLDAFCVSRKQPAAEPAASIQALPPGIVRLDARGAAVGFAAPPADRPALAALGIAEAPWIVPAPAESVPKVSLADVAAGRTPLSVAAGRVVIAALDSPFEPRTSAAGAPEISMGTHVASALGGLLDGGARREAPRWISALIASLSVLILAFVRRVASIKASLIALGVCLLATILGQAILAASMVRGLLPAASLASGILAGAIVALSLDLSGWRRAVARTSDLLGREGIFRRVQTEPDAVFWPRLGRLAGRLFPADFVLVAELPSAQWHLKFWDDGDVGEHLIGERRRDVRRRPYINEHGVAAPHVVTDYLKNPGEPSLVVPLIALGETEGYVFLCGPKAEAAFAKTPERLERLARELALIARRRRLGSLGEGEPLSGSRLLDAPLPPSERLVQRADGAAKEIATFGEVLRSSPVGLFYADALGDVRLASRELNRWLGARGVSVPPESADGALPPGSIHLSQILVALTGCTAEEAATSMAEVLQSESGITGRSPPGTAPAFVLTVRALRQKADGFSSIVGYVASVVEQPEDKPTNVRALATAPTHDPLSAFPLSEVIAQAVAGTARATGRQVKIEPMRGMGHVIGHRSALERALEAFMVEAAGQSPSAQPPVISVRETSTAVELSILDWSLGFGLPESALQRVLIAPGAAPPGLEVLGRLIMSIEDSHGAVQIRSEDGWGLTLVVSLLRAKPRVKVAVGEGGASAVDNVVALGRNTAK